MDLDVKECMSLFARGFDTAPTAPPKFRIAPRRIAHSPAAEELNTLRTSEAIRFGFRYNSNSDGYEGHKSNFEKAHESKALLHIEQSEEEPVSCASIGQE